MMTPHRNIMNIFFIRACQNLLELCSPVQHSAINPNFTKSITQLHPPHAHSTPPNEHSPPSSQTHQSSQHPSKPTSSKLTSSKPPLSQKVRFIDKARLELSGGQGGNGSVAFAATGRGRHLKADGGHGGRGGDVILRATRRILSLAGIHQHVSAENGAHGSSQGRQGANGKPCVVEVPVGTIIKKLGEGGAEDVLSGPDVGEELGPDGLPMWMSSPHTPTYGLLEDDDEGGEGGEEEEEERESRRLKQRQRRRREESAEVLTTMMRDGEEMVVVKGGDGGRGNIAFHRKPYGPPSETSEEGKPGERVSLLLEAKLIADVGLVGLPNAGKSTLLAAITGARAQIGSYEFTTLRPQLGTLVFDDGRRLTVADIPGLLEGASTGSGRGNEFLRHIERTRCLAYVVDLSGGEGGLVGLSASQQLAVLQRELKMYRPELLKAPAVVVANKVDCVTDPKQAISALSKCTQLPVVPLSARDGAGLQLLQQVLSALAPPDWAS